MDARDLRLRPATTADTDFFYALRKEGFQTYVEQAHGEPWRDEAHRPLAETELAALPFDIVERAGVPIGYLAVVRHDDHWFLDEIALVASARNDGLGTHLLRRVMKDSMAGGVPLRLSVLQVNEPAQRLYARLGFRIERIDPPRMKMVWP